VCIKKPVNVALYVDPLEHGLRHEVCVGDRGGEVAGNRYPRQRLRQVGLAAEARPHEQGGQLPVTFGHPCQHGFVSVVEHGPVA
jgi:hypothetical protein